MVDATADDPVVGLGFEAATQLRTRKLSLFQVENRL